MADQPEIQIANDELVLGPVRISFERTLRIPETGVHDLPPGLGEMTIRNVADYPGTAPRDWLDQGGVMVPVYQREALWIMFAADEPAAVQVGIGNVCAISGRRWPAALTQDRQNYVALPRQPWLDGINAGDGFIRQFVATALGSGATVEAQVTGEESVGGLQLRMVPLTEDARKRWSDRPGPAPAFSSGDLSLRCAPPPGAAMGLGAGGRMRQEIYADSRALDDYNQAHPTSVFVHLCSASAWTDITGEPAPPTPIDRETYVAFGLPWFDYFDADGTDIAHSDVLASVKSVGTVLNSPDVSYTPTDPDTVVTIVANP